MEFVYAAVNSDNGSLKGKMSKWRHLQTILMQLLLVGLLFFLILQNGQLKREISSKLSHQFVEDIFNQKISQLSKELEDIKAAVGQAARYNAHQHQQTKKIVKHLIKQMGLPLESQQRQKRNQGNQKNQLLQLIEFIQNEGLVQHKKYPVNFLQQQTQNEQIQESEYQTLEQEDQTQNGYYFDEEQEEQLPTCNYYYYLTQEQHSHSESDQNYQMEKSGNKNIGNLSFKQFIEVQNHPNSNSFLIAGSFGCKLMFCGGVIVSLIIFLSVCLRKGCRKWNKLRNLVWQVKPKKQCYTSSKK